MASAPTEELEVSVVKELQRPLKVHLLPTAAPAAKAAWQGRLRQAASAASAAKPVQRAAPAQQRLAVSAVWAGKATEPTHSAQSAARVATQR